MELFFLCTIALAIVSFISMALAQPPAAMVSNKATDASSTMTKAATKKEASIIEFTKERKELELLGLATA